MDNKLFELCKEVYERTRWDERDLRHKLGNDVYDRPLFQSDTDEEHPEDSYHPLYTSDYLLEKLPRFIDKLEPGEAPSSNDDADDKVQYVLVLGVLGNRWNAYYSYEDAYADHLVIADTPLKSLLKLTIALDEAGELK